MPGTPAPASALSPPLPATSEAVGTAPNGTPEDSTVTLSPRVKLRLPLGWVAGGLALAFTLGGAWWALGSHVHSAELHLNPAQAFTIEKAHAFVSDHPSERLTAIETRTSEQDRRLTEMNGRLVRIEDKLDQALDRTRPPASAPRFRATGARRTP